MDILIDPYRYGIVPVRVSTFTSSPYPATLDDALNISGALTSAALYAWPIEAYDVGHAVMGGSLNVVQVYYTHPDAEAYNVGHSALGGSLTTVQLYYTHPDPEAYDVGHSVQGGTLVVVQITYSYWPAEGLDISGAFVSGALT